MREIETLTKDNWEEFLSAPASVLILAKSDCGACKTWGEELGEFLQSSEDWNHVRFGKLNLDQPGLIAFKRNSPWLNEVTDLPYTVIYKEGEKLKAFVGGGLERLQKRLSKTVALAEV